MEPYWRPNRSSFSARSARSSTASLLDESFLDSSACLLPYTARDSGRNFQSYEQHGKDNNTLPSATSGQRTQTPRPICVSPALWGAIPGYLSGASSGRLGPTCASELPILSTSRSSS